MSEGSKSISDLLRENIERGRTQGLYYQQWFVQRRRTYGEQTLNNILLYHDKAYDWLKYKDIDNMFFLYRPKAYLDNFILDNFSKISRPAIYHIGTGLGVAMDKVVGKTLDSISPYNFMHIINNPARARLYFEERGIVYRRYYNAIDFSNIIRTGSNLASIWQENFTQSLSMQKYIWNEKLRSEYSVLQPKMLIMDKSSQLARAYFDVLTDRLAETMGWCIIGMAAFTLPKTVRTRTKLATQRWSSRLYVTYLPITFRFPINLFVIKPPVKLFYNPYVVAALLGYKYLSGLGQKIDASIQLEQREPEITRRTTANRRQISSASAYNDLTLSIDQQTKSNGLNS